MKKTILLFLTYCLCATGCSTQQTDYDTELCILIDKTDTLTTYPTAKNIITQLGIETGKNQNVRITVTYISDTDINETSVITLRKESILDGSALTHDAQVHSFTNQLQQILTKMKTATTCEHSIIYKTIARQVRTLVAAHATNKYLLVYSNLYENSEVNFYDPQIFTRLRTNPGSVQRQLDATNPLPTLNGVQVWLLYSPLSYKDNNTYMVLADFYKHLLEGHGAQVRINNTFTIQ